MLSARVAIVALLAVLYSVNAAPATPVVPEALAAGDVPPGYKFCTQRDTYMACYNLCGPGGYWFIAPKCCCP